MMVCYTLTGDLPVDSLLSVYTVYVCDLHHPAPGVRHPPFRSSEIQSAHPRTHSLYATGIPRCHIYRPTSKSAQTPEGPFPPLAQRRSILQSTSTAPHRRTRLSFARGPRPITLRRSAATDAAAITGPTLSFQTPSVLRPGWRSPCRRHRRAWFAGCTGPRCG